MHILSQEIFQWLLVQVKVLHHVPSSPKIDASDLGGIIYRLGKADIGGHTNESHLSSDSKSHHTLRLPLPRRLHRRVACADHYSRPASSARRAAARHRAEALIGSPRRCDQRRIGFGVIE